MPDVTFDPPQKPDAVADDELTKRAEGGLRDRQL